MMKNQISFIYTILHLLLTSLFLGFSIQEDVEPVCGWHTVLKSSRTFNRDRIETKKVVLPKTCIKFDG